MNGSELGDGSVWFTFDFEGEGDFVEFVVDFSGGVGFGIFEGADEDVFEIGDTGSESPGGVGGIADDNSGDTGDIHSGDFEVGGFDSGFVDNAGGVVAHLGGREEDGVVGG